MSDWTQTQSGDEWTHPDGRRIDYTHDYWWAHEPGEPWLAEGAGAPHEAAIACGWHDFPADPLDPDTMLGFMTLCAVLRVWATGWEWRLEDDAWQHIGDYRSIIPTDNGYLACSEWGMGQIAPTPVECARLAGWHDFPGAAP